MEKPKTIYKYIIPILLLGCFIVLSLTYFQYTKYTSIEVSSELIDIGKIDKDDPAEAIFSIKNIGNTALIIDRIETDCHCTGLQWENIPIDSGNSTNISVSYDKHMPGLFQQLITVYSNAKNSPHVVVFRGKII